MISANGQRSTSQSCSRSSTINVVVDSGPLVTNVDRADPRQKAVTRIFERLRATFLVPDPVIAEVDHLLRRRVSHRSARAFLEDVHNGLLQRVPLDDPGFSRAVQYDRSFEALGIGIGDASIMALAERERAVIFTFDFKDFRATRPFRGGYWRLLVDEDGFRRLSGR